MSATTHKYNPEQAQKKAFRISSQSHEMYELLKQAQNYQHEPLPEHLQKEIAHILFTIDKTA